MASPPSPKDHPNAFAALAAGYIATIIVYGAKKAGVDITPAEASSGAVALISLALFAAGKVVKQPDPPADG